MTRAVAALNGVFHYSRWSPLTVFENIGPILPLPANGDSVIKEATMQDIIARTNHPLAEGLENTIVKPIAEIEDAIRNFVRRDGDSPKSKDPSVTAVNVNSLVERSGTLSELQSVIEELEELYDFLHSEGERLEREISEYARVSKSTIRSTEVIAANVLHREKTGADKP